MTEGQTPPPSASPNPPLNYQTPPDGGYAGPAPDQDSKNLSMISHILNFMFLVPLLIYLLKKDSHPFLADQSRESLNFSLNCLIIHIICAFTSFLCIPALISLALFIAQIVLGIIGGLKARDGIAYRYPLVIRMIK
jgi:uncharacterized Tic20 family protein